MTNPTPTLTDEQRTELVWAYAYSGCTHTDGVDPDAVTGCRDCQRITDRVIPVVARMVADAEQRGRAEVSAAVESVLAHPYPDVALDAFSDDQQAAVAIASAALRRAMKGDIRAVLTNEIGASDV